MEMKKGRKVRFAVNEQGVSHTLGKEVLDENSLGFDFSISDILDEIRLPSIIQQNSSLVAYNKKINFLLRENNPAPNGSECVIYLSRNISCIAQKGTGKLDSTMFYGKLRGEREPLLLNFHLTYDDGAEYYGLRIVDAERPFESHLSLAHFQQASLLLQFIKPGHNGESTIVHEEPAFQISLDRPNVRWQDQELENILCRSNRHFSVSCPNVFPVNKLPEVVQERKLILMRIYMKLMQGEVDTLHGIQKCFHPDKALFDLRDVMEKSFASGMEADVTVVSGADFVGYAAHRSVLAANSDVLRASFTHEMKESKNNSIVTPPYVTAQALEAFLKFLYARNRKDLLNKPDLTMNVLRLAHFYGMELLVDVCEESILAMPINKFSLDSCLCIFLHASIFDKAAIETKIVHVLMGLNVKLSTSAACMNFLQTTPEVAAKMSDMFVQFKGTTSFK